MFTQFANWTTDGKIPGSRIKEYATKWPDLVEKALECRPSINTGVYAYRKDSPIFPKWLEVATWGGEQGFFIPDEVAANIVAPQYNCKVMPSRYNASCKRHIDEDEEEPVVIAHMHGRGHIDSLLAPHWLSEFEECLAGNVCGMVDLCSGDFGGDKKTAEYMARRSEAKDVSPIIMPADREATLANFAEALTPAPARSTLIQADVTGVAGQSGSLRVIPQITTIP